MAAVANKIVSEEAEIEDWHLDLFSNIHTCAIAPVFIHKCAHKHTHTQRFFKSLVILKLYWSYFPRYVPPAPLFQH